MLLVERVVSLFRGIVLFNEVTMDDEDAGAIINVMIAFTKRNVTVREWLRVAIQMSKLS